MFARLKDLEETGCCEVGAGRGLMGYSMMVRMLVLRVSRV